MQKSRNKKKKTKWGGGLISIKRENP